MLVIGAAQATMEIALKYVKVNVAQLCHRYSNHCISFDFTKTLEMQERKQFGKFISDFQHTQFKLADMAGKIQTARLMLRYGPYN